RILATACPPGPEPLSVACPSCASSTSDQSLRVYFPATEAVPHRAVHRFSIWLRSPLPVNLQRFPPSLGDLGHGSPDAGPFRSKAGRAAPPRHRTSGRAPSRIEQREFVCVPSCPYPG